MLILEKTKTIVGENMKIVPCWLTEAFGLLTPLHPQNHHPKSDTCVCRKLACTEQKSQKTT